MTKKSNCVELASDFGKIKPCGNPHGSRSDNQHWCQTLVLKYKRKMQLKSQMLSN